MRLLAPSIFPFLALAGDQSQQQPPASFRAGVSIVAVDAQVVDGSRIITGLKKDDFIVFEDGKPQTVLYFGVESEPLDLLLLIDKSGSMQPVVAELAVSAIEALTTLRSGDRVGVMLFASNSELLLAPISDLEEVARQLQSAVRDDKIGGGTDINGAVFEAARYMRRQPKTNARRSLLILTDNFSHKSRRDQAVVNELWEADAVLNALLFRSGFEKVVWNYHRAMGPWRLLMTADVKKIVDQTGGESLEASAPSEGFRAVLERIRKRYTLHYRAPPGPAGKVRSIRVDLSPEAKTSYPHARVRARRGYVAHEAVQ